MDSLPVTLIVKAPNQQIEDQKIRCETSWSINKLKQHLSEVYPSKPPQNEQKLIYSGQLLSDSVILKDVLRQYEGQDTHTVHLVCTPRLLQMHHCRARPFIPRPENRNASGESANPPTTSANPTSSTVSPESIAQPTVQPPSPNADTRVPTAGLPNNGGFPNNGLPWMHFAGQIPQMPPVDLNALNHYHQMQMVYMQQAYMQYMAQYMHLAPGQHPTILPHMVPPPNFAQNPFNGQQQPPEAPQMAQPNDAAQPQQENEDRDWLDLFYMLSRAMVLLSVVYFYSSPVRFIFVLLLGISLYLYQAGFFRNININNNNINGTPEGAPQEEQAPTRFMVAWTFITTFFASLVPEIPNINA